MLAACENRPETAVTMTGQDAIRFVEKHGIVLESAHGPVPCLADEIAGQRIKGSWWSHPESHTIHRLTGEVRRSSLIHVCRLVEGKVTLVHRRLWPALVRLADRFARERLSAIREIHTASGHHVVAETPFPDWVPPEVMQEAKALEKEAAAAALGPWLST